MDEYFFEWNLKKVALSNASIHYSPKFFIENNTFNIMLEKKDFDINYGVFLCSLDPSSIYPGVLRYQFDLFANNNLVKSCTFEDSFYKSYYGLGPFDFIDPETVCECVLKVRVWSQKSFSDFVEKPVGFRDNSHFLFDKVLSRLCPPRITGVKE
jgi:hypothetical protein